MKNKLSIEDMDKLCEDDRLINWADNKGISVDDLKEKIVQFFINNFHIEYDVLIKDEYGVDIIASSSKHAGWSEACDVLKELQKTSPESKPHIMKRYVGSWNKETKLNVT